MIDAQLETPEAKVLVTGDFNDTEDSEVIKAVKGKGQGQFIDARPQERDGNLVSANGSPAWTNCFEEQGLYERIDFILMSPAMAGVWVPEESFVLGSPDWRVASDHRPVVAAFHK